MGKPKRADVARSLDVHVNTLHGWVGRAKAHGMATPKRRSPEHEEIARLRRELRHMTARGIALQRPSRRLPRLTTSSAR